MIDAIRSPYRRAVRIRSRANIHYLYQRHQTRAVAVARIAGIASAEARPHIQVQAIGQPLGKRLIEVGGEVGAMNVEARQIAANEVYLVAANQVDTRDEHPNKQGNEEPGE